jgi:hypothetical protein
VYSLRLNFIPVSVGSEAVSIPFSTVCCTPPMQMDKKNGTVGQRTKRQSIHRQRCTMACFPRLTAFSSYFHSFPLHPELSLSLFSFSHHIIRGSGVQNDVLVLPKCFVRAYTKMETSECKFYPCSLRAIKLPCCYHHASGPNALYAQIFIF